MAQLIINGGKPLNGEITPSANKNAVLPALCASLLTDEPVVLTGVPNITDVRQILDFFSALGSRIEADFISGVVRVEHGSAVGADGTSLPTGMRSAIMLVPGLLHRFGRAVLEDEVKGCTLGVREIDPHLDVFQAFGARIDAAAGRVEITAPAVFRASRRWLDYASVTTTENFLMCAMLSQGTSTLVNAACEPHVQEFCNVLRCMGGEISGVGSSTLSLTAPREISGAEHTFADDFHEIVTFLALGSITGGAISVRNNTPEHFPLLDRTFAKFGVAITHENGWTRAHASAALAVERPHTAHMLSKVEAAPWPYVPADLLPIFIALGVRAEGSMLFWNKVYEGALGWTSELSKFGAHAVTCDPHRVIIFGGRPLIPAQVESPYIIRVAIALLMIAASIEGQSSVLNAEPIRRAHPRFAENLQALGADIEWRA